MSLTKELMTKVRRLMVIMMKKEMAVENGFFLLIIVKVVVVLFDFHFAPAAAVAVVHAAFALLV